jgi:hypothetical protein
MILDEETNHRPLFIPLSSIKAPTLEKRKPKERRVHKVHKAWTHLESSEKKPELKKLNLLFTVNFL